MGIGKLFGRWADAPDWARNGIAMSFSGLHQGCVFGMDEKVGAWIAVIRSRFEPWGGVGGMSAGGCEE